MPNASTLADMSPGLVKVVERARRGAAQTLPRAWGSVSGMVVALLRLRTISRFQHGVHGRALGIVPLAAGAQHHRDRDAAIAPGLNRDLGDHTAAAGAGPEPPRGPIIDQARPGRG